MGVRKVAIVAVLFSLFHLVSMAGIAFAFSGNWVDVARFTGAAYDRIHKTESSLAIILNGE